MSAALVSYPEAVHITSPHVATAAVQSVMSTLEKDGSPSPATMAKLEEMQVKDMLRMFNGLVERCFSECVSSFRSKALTGPEETCVNACAEKYLKHSARVGLRFGEITMAQQQEGAG